ncbi:MAG TPA: hypothetical protein VM263_07495, partial [Acidimicrobiales bacterium]|nr:hypothetical protein [Acidimicrobiales bacterium]
ARWGGAAAVLAVLGAAVAPLAGLAGPVAAAVVAAWRLRCLYRSAPGRSAAERAGAALAGPRRAVEQAAAAVERLAAERAALDRAAAAADEEARAERERLRRRRDDDLARVDEELDAALAAVGEREREVQRAELDARAAALVELQARVVDDHLGHHSLAAATSTGGVSTQVVRRLSLDGVRTAADFTGVELERTGAVVVARDGRRLTVGAVGPAEAAAMMAWRGQVVVAARMKVPTTLPPGALAAIRAAHDPRRAALAAEADAAREEARRRAAAVRAAAAREESALTARRAGAAVGAARRRVEVDRLLVTAGKDAAEARWHLDQAEGEQGSTAPATAGAFLRAVAGLRRPSG